ncbi:MAG: helix-turn-helix transcriptional regulator [Eubacteriales bacterium]|nr:helix-turn-helix transcriptional regulator [Eubacteriales bacterium]
MILADKIIENRKKNGWSQEDLAERLGVSRQSVSKWEGAQAVPDMKKILQLAEAFGVTTDYLLRDEIEERFVSDSISIDNGIEETTRTVSMEEANSFLKYNAKAASTISTGVMLCILSPIILIFLAWQADEGKLAGGENMAAMVGVTVLLVIVAIAVAMFLTAAMRGKPYEYLEEMDIETEYGVSGMVKERRDDYGEKHSRLLIIGIILCVLSVIPLILTELLHYSSERDMAAILGVLILLAIVAVGVKMIVLTCIRQGGFDKLLEEGDYTRLNKRSGKYDGIYWAIVLAAYLAWSFITSRWDMTWIIWPVAGALFVAYHEIMKALVRSVKK